MRRIACLTVLTGLLFQLLDLAAEGAAERNARLVTLVSERRPGLADALFIALTDPDTGVRQIALANLGLAVGDPRLLPSLQQQIEHSTPQTRWLAVRALATIPSAFTAMGARASELAVDSDAVVRRALLAHIADGPGVQAIAKPFLLRALESTDPGDRMAAATSLRRLKVVPPEATIQRLVQDLGSADAATAGGASYALTMFWDAGKLQVESAVRNGSALARVAAAELLRKQAVDFDPKPLAEVFRLGGEVPQLAACGTLGRLSSPNVIPILTMALSSPHARVRQAAVYALEAAGSPEAVEALDKALSHPDTNIRYRTAIVLGRMQAAGRAANLRSVATHDSDPGVRTAARFAAAVAAGGDLAKVLPGVEEIAKEARRSAPQRVRPAAGRSTVIENGVIRIGSQKQLLVDDLTIESRKGASRVFHKFVKDSRNPIFEQQAPWEYQGVLDYCTTADYDPGSHLFRLWYTSYLRAPDATADRGGLPTSRRKQLIAYSADGRNWIRPNLGLAGVNNIVGATDSIVRLPAAYENRFHFASYSPFRKDGRYSLAVSFSPDGISGWTELKPLQSAGGDVITVTRDDIAGGYMGFTKWRSSWWLGQSFGDLFGFNIRSTLHVASGMRSFAPIWGGDPVNFRRGEVNVLPNAVDDAAAPARVAAAYSGLDFFAADEMRAEVYEVTPFLYEGIYFGLPAVFYASGRGGANDDGLMMLSLIFSRDRMGKGGWQRNGSGGFEPALELGHWGEWDSTQMYGPSTLLVVNDEIVLYYSGLAIGHEPKGSRSDGAGRTYYRSAIGRATMRLDGMASLHAEREDAVITTKPLVFEGDSLEVNVRGKLTVEVLDVNGKLLAGFGRADSIPYQGDSVGHKVEWRTGKSLAALAGKQVRLRFRLTNGDLYAYRFAETSGSK